MGATEHYGFTLSSDPVPNTDREFIDQLIYWSITGHTHTGTTPSVSAPGAPTLAISEGLGNLAAGTRYFYAITQVDADGFESVASGESFVDTPSPVTRPEAPTLATTTTGGTLTSGTYMYVMTAYVGTSAVETEAGPRSSVIVPLGTETNKVTVTFPTLPAGADGFNIYVKEPGTIGYFLLTTVDMTVMTPPTSYDHTVLLDCATSRTAPSRNGTSVTSSVDVTYPGGVPVGSTWKIYRSTTSGSFGSTLLYHVVEGINTFTDTGLPTTSGTPPSANYLPANPAKVSMLDAAEVQGRLPMGLVAGFPDTIVFSTTVPVVGEDVFIYPIEWPTFQILGVRATLKTAPTGSAVQVDIKRSTDNGGSWTSIFTNPTYPQVTVGNTLGTRLVPTTTTATLGHLLRMDVLQADSNAIAAGLTVSVHGVSIYTTTSSSNYTT